MNYINKDNQTVSLALNTKEDAGAVISFKAYEDGNKDSFIDLGDRTLINNSYYQSVAFDPSSFDFKDEIYYELEGLNSGGDVVYRGRVFITSQDITAYKINDNDYTQDDSGDNEYILY
jgi:hypothetical protein